MNWYIGQEVVCVKAHERGLVVEGKTYTIKGLRGSRCKCNHVAIDVGIRLPQNRSQNCLVCNIYWDTFDDVIFFKETRFAPLIDISELKEILNEEIQRV